MVDPRGPATPQTPSAVDAVHELARLIDAGRAQEALALASSLFARSDLPHWLVADLCNLAGVAAWSLGLEPVAEQMWREALKHQPMMAAAHAQLGRLLARRERDDEAALHCHLALQAEPQRLDVLLVLGAVLARQQQSAEAEAVYRQALQVAPGSAAAWTDLGVLLASLKRLDEAAQCHLKALALKPDDAHANTNHGLLLFTMQRFAEAEIHQRRAVAAAPNESAIHSNLGNLLAEMDCHEEAERSLRRAIELDPSSASAHCNLGALYRLMGRPADAEVALRQALELKPTHVLAQLHLSSLLLAQGQFDEGWRLHEARWNPALIDNGIPPPKVAFPRWQGEPLQGRSVLVWPEQGLGDQIQFARYAPLLKTLGAANVTLVCQKPLKALFDTLEGVDQVLAAEIVDNSFVVPGVDLSTHDYWVFPLSLPHRFGTRLDSIPAAIPYLKSSPDRMAYWSQRLPRHDMKKRVGLVWRGNPKHDNDRDRSIAQLQTLAPLWAVPGLQFISLQPGQAGLAALQSLPSQPLVPLGQDLRDFADTAALVASLDLLICVDTSIAHLAGAIGAPCWLLLPSHRTDWRWLQQRDDSPWYPGCLRLFRQPSRGDWASVVEAVRLALIQWCAMRSSTSVNC